VTDSHKCEKLAQGSTTVLAGTRTLCLLIASPTLCW